MAARKKKASNKEVSDGNQPEQAAAAVNEEGGSGADAGSDSSDAQAPAGEGADQAAESAEQPSGQADTSNDSVDDGEAGDEESEPTQEQHAKFHAISVASMHALPGVIARTGNFSVEDPAAVAIKRGTELVEQLGEIDKTKL